MRIFRQAIETIGGSRARNSSNDSNGHESPQRSNSTNVFHIDKKYQTPDFLFQSPKVSTLPKRKTSPVLSKSFFSSLTQLEGKIAKQKSHDIIERLVQMYQQCVEVYDSLQDPIKYYFLDKMQGALADAETWRIIQKDEIEEVFHDIDETIAQSNRNMEALRSGRNSGVIPKPPNSPKAEEDEEDQMGNIRRARSKMVSMNKQVIAEQQTSGDNLNLIVNDYQCKVGQQLENQTIRNEQFIKDSLQSQEETIQDRLARRRKGGKDQESQPRRMMKSHTAGILETPSKDLADLIK